MKPDHSDRIIGAIGIAAIIATALVAGPWRESVPSTWRGGVIPASTAAPAASAAAADVATAAVSPSPPGAPVEAERSLALAAPAMWASAKATSAPPASATARTPPPLSVADSSGTTVPPAPAPDPVPGALRATTTDSTATVAPPTNVALDTTASVAVPTRIVEGSPAQPSGAASPVASAAPATTSLPASIANASEPAAPAPSAAAVSGATMRPEQAAGPAERRISGDSMAPGKAEATPAEHAKFVVDLLTGGDGGSIQMAQDLAGVINDGDTQRLLFTVGTGGLQDVADLEQLHGLDVAIVQSDVLDEARRREMARGLDGAPISPSSIPRSCTSLLAPTSGASMTLPARRLLSPAVPRSPGRPCSRSCM
jgi:hypothetical protein